MEQALLIILGSLLGLLSPAIVNKISQEYRKKSLFKAISAELKDFKYRISLAHILLMQRHGKIDKEYLRWIKPRIDEYDGNEPKGPMLEMIEKMLEAEDEAFDAVVSLFQAAQGQGMVLKQYRLSLLDSHVHELSIFPLPIQTKIHELINQINIINQDVNSNNDFFKMTFDSSISGENHQRLGENINAQYKYLTRIYKTAIIKAEAILSEKI